MALEISVGNWEGRSGCPPVSDWEGRPQAGNSLVETSHEGVCVCAFSPQEVGGSVALGTWIGYQKILTSAKEVCLLSVVRHAN